MGRIDQSNPIIKKMTLLDKKFSICQVQIFILALPMIRPFTTSFGTIKDKSTILVKAYTQDGIIGWGEAAVLSYPLYKPDTVDTTFIALKNYILPQILNKPIKHPKNILKLYSSIKGYNFAKTAVETAVWMIYSLKKNQPLSKLLGGIKTKIAVGESIGIKDSIKETLEEINLRCNQGFRRIKIKIKPKWDLKVVKAVRQEFGNKLDLMIDANSAYTLKDLSLFKKLDQFNLTMIEQPLADDDIVDHSILQRQIKTPICLDESINSAEDARRAIYLKACKVINIKPGRVGGLWESKKIHDLCRRHNIGVWCGGMLEIGIGRAFNIAIASLPNFIFPSDTSPAHFYFQEDLIEPTYKVDKSGYIKVPEQPGLGYLVNEQKVKKYTVNKLCFY